MPRSRLGMKIRTVELIVLAAAVLGGAAQAQEPEPGGWSFTIAPYFWAAGLDGEVGVGNQQADVDVSFSDILKDLKFGGMLLSEARKDRFGAFFAPLYVRIGEDAQSGPFDVDVTSDVAVVGGGVFYRMAEWNLGQLGEGRSRKAWIEPLAGARWTYLRLEIDGSGLLDRQADRNENWIDPFVGVQVGVDLAEHWVLAAEGDIGGFGVGSDFAWNALGLIAYRTTLLGIDTRFGAGYRALSWDYDDDDFKWDVVMHGPFIGSAFRF